MADAEVERRMKVMRGDTCTISTRRRTYRRIESKAGSSRSHKESYIQKERSYLQFIKIETKNPPTSIPCSSSLTRRFFDRPLDSKCFNVGALDQLFIRDGTLDKLLWNHNWSVDGTVSFFRYPADKKLPSRWSPLGSFFVTSNYDVVSIWGSRYYTDFGRLMRFSHYQVEEFDISPGEKYLVTYNRPDPTDPNGLWLKIFDVSTGTGIVGLNNGDVADSPQWPAIRWAGGKDDTYFATLSKSNTVSVYEARTFNLLGKSPLKLDDVIDISWSPTEAVLAILLKAGGEQPLKVLLLQIPDEVKLAEKEITAIVGDCKMHWQSNGEYLAVNTYGGFEFFRIKEEGIPTDFLKVDKRILAFAWEPSGHRFAVIYGDEPTLSVSFYSMKTPGKITELTTLSNKQADSLFWSPKGNLVVVAALKEGKLEFFDVDRLAQISSVANVKANQVVWNPSGEYVATVSTIPQEEFYSDWCSDPNDPLDRFTIWSSGGDCLFVHQCQNRIMQLDWRPYGGIIDDDMLKTQ
ncbi:hypothetical protein Bca4012_079360 [Brassica carinata]